MDEDFEVYDADDLTAGWVGGGISPIPERPSDKFIRLSQGNYQQLRQVMDAVAKGKRITPALVKKAEGFLAELENPKRPPWKKG